MEHPGIGRPFEEARARIEEATGSLYLNRREAAKYLNIPVGWLANNVRRGPRYIKVGGLVRYSVSALDSFMKSHEGSHL